MMKMTELLPCVEASSRLLIRAPTLAIGSAATSMGTFRALVVFALLAFAAELAEGKQCGHCLTYWECTVTGGTPIGYCDPDSSSVCCSFGNDHETTVDRISGAEPAFTEPQNDLEQEKPATEIPPFRAKPRHPPILSTSVSPPPPVRLFGDRITRPVISSALGHSVPVKPLVTKVLQGGDPREDRSKLDAFPASVTAKPVINRVPSRTAPPTLNQPASLTNSFATNRDANRGNQTATLRIVPVKEVVTVVQGHNVPSHLIRGSASPTGPQPLGQTIKLPPGRHILKIVQTPGELTQVSLRPFPVKKQEDRTVISTIQDSNASQKHSSQPRKTFSFRPHRAPSSQQLSVQEEDTDHEEIAPSELPPAVHEAVRQGFPGREIKRVFKHSQTSRPVLILGSRSSRARTFSFSDSTTTVETLGETLESVTSPRFSFRDTKQRHN